MKIYRIIEKVTGSLQPGDSFWEETALYCGPDRGEARTAYHTSTAEDSACQNYGTSYRETVAQVIEDSGDGFGDDEVKELDWEGVKA